jgi:hypothetical protein
MSGRPVLVNTENRPLYRIRPGSKHARALYEEKTIQELLHDHPELLPVHEIWPDSSQWVSLGREMQVSLSRSKNGYIDNLFVTAEGRLILVEAKLYRNHEGRRQVVAQLLEYAAALSKLDYTSFTKGLPVFKDDPVADLHAFICARLGPDKVNSLDLFRRVVIESLSKAEFLLLIIGDGIQEEVENLVGILQSHPGLQFTLGLVSLGLYSDEEDGPIVLAVPHLHTRTREVKRAVVVVERRGDGAEKIFIEVSREDGEDETMTLNDSSSRATRRQWDQSSFLERVDEKFGRSIRGTFEALLEAAAQRDAEISWGTGIREGAFMLHFEDVGDRRALVKFGSDGLMRFYNAHASEEVFTEQFDRFECFQDHYRSYKEWFDISWEFWSEHVEETIELIDSLRDAIRVHKDD